MEARFLPPFPSPLLPPASRFSAGIFRGATPRGHAVTQEVRQEWGWRRNLEASAGAPRLVFFWENPCRFLTSQPSSSSTLCTRVPRGLVDWRRAPPYLRASWNSEGIRDHDLYLRRRSPVPSRPPAPRSMPAFLTLAGPLGCVLLGGDVRNSCWTWAVGLALCLVEPENSRLSAAYCFHRCFKAHD